ncbi:MAG: MBL fold metallo-hydrolase [Candidatus Nealsonbacteria bacterium]|nr:MBL fold metallo-hydrolase [Candidatus Nealsonbacteria bacterium]
MNITWHGQSFFRITTQKDKNTVDVVIDPYNKESGLTPPKVRVDILIVSDNKLDQKSFPNIEGSPFLISFPGEYEVKDVFVQGLTEDHKTTFYFIEAEGIRICHLGKFSQKEMSPDQLESLGDVDILFLPIGGGDTIEAKDAAKIVAQIEPKIVIPMNYKIPGLKDKLEGLDEFLKIMGIETKEELAKLSIKQKDLSFEEKKPEIVILSPKN